MNYKGNSFLTIHTVRLISCICLLGSAHGETADQPLVFEEIPKEVSAPDKMLKQQDKEIEKTIRFDFDNEDLVDIINYLAAQKGVNIILPQGANAIASKVTFSIAEKISLPQAWEHLHTILDIAGFTLMPKGTLYEIVKNNGQLITKEPLPLYIGIGPDKLPDTDQRIRYLYYLSNIKVSEEDTSEIKTILTNILPQATSIFKVDPTTNSILLVAKANDIRAVMKIILEIDKIDFQETLSIIKLRYATASTLASIFTDQILKSPVAFSPYNLDARQQSEAGFFAKHIRIFPEDRTNSLIVLGRPQAIERVKDFIFKYIDVELEGGKSVLHVYPLQYLDADKLVPVLRQIIESATTGGTEQARVAGATPAGTQRTFDQVLIFSDKPKDTGDTSSTAPYYGGNKLIIAAREDDWKVLEKIIAQLDIPQPQVLLEVLIADLTLEDIKLIGNIMRNPTTLPLPGTANAQTAQIGQVMLDDNTNPTTLQSDLLRLAFNPDGTPGNQNSLAYVLTNGNNYPGSTLVAFNEANGKTWGLLQFLKTLSNTKILTHPHVIATNNQEAIVNIGQSRLLQDESVPGGQAVTIKNKKIDANLTVTLTPRISAADTVHLHVKIDINDYESNSINSRIIRQVSTNALVKNKDILALGGLVELNSNDALNETPILGKIPIIGYFFKRRAGTTNKTNLTVFISPTIIEPRLRSGVSDYTKQYINLAKTYVRDGSLFDSLKDPITHWFFNSGHDTEDIMDEYLSKDEFKRDLLKKENPEPEQITPVKSKRKRKKLPGNSTSAQLTKETNDKASMIQQMVEQDEESPLLGP